MNKIIQISIFALIFLSLSNLYAQKPRFDFVFGLGLTTGGDKMAEYPIIISSEFGSRESSEDIRAGDTRIFFLGGNIYFSNFPVGLQITWNYHYAIAEYVEGLNSDFERNSIDLLPYYRYNEFRFGVGLSYYMNVRFIEDAVGTGINRKGEIIFDDVQGYIFEVDYIWNKVLFFTALSVGFRYTQVEYQPYQINGNCIGIIFSASIF